jgi:hypothetical protein
MSPALDDKDQDIIGRCLVAVLVGFDRTGLRLILSARHDSDHSFEAPDFHITINNFMNGVKWRALSEAQNGS